MKGIVKTLKALEEIAIRASENGDEGTASEAERMMKEGHRILREESKKKK